MKLKTKLLSIIAPAALLTTAAPIALTSCGVVYTTQVMFGRSKSSLCGYNPCKLEGYEQYYATTQFKLLVTGSETVTIKASNISITCKGKEYPCKGFATLSTVEGETTYIASVATEFKFKSGNEIAQYVMFDNEMWENCKDDTTATAKINSTSNIPFYTYTNITFNL